MNPLFLDRIGLVCPKCRVPAPEGMSDHTLVLNDVVKMEAGYILEGFLKCSNPRCDAVYPIHKGIPCVLRDENAIRQCLSEASEQAAIRHISYLDAQYYDVCMPPPTLSNQRFNQAVLGAVKSRSDGNAMPVIDLGCATGRHTFAMADHFPFAVGMDTDIHALACAAALQRGQPLNFDRPVRALATQAVTISRPVSEQVLFILGDALDPPFRAESFRFVSALNLIDSISEPMILLKQMDALLEPGGTLLLTSPFAWEESICDPSQWLEDPETSPAIMTQQILTGERLPEANLSYTIQSVIADIPWALPIAVNHWSQYRTFLLKAVKNANTAG